jgi:hypothetical protein
MAKIPAKLKIDKSPPTFHHNCIKPPKIGTAFYFEWAEFHQIFENAAHQRCLFFKTKKLKLKKKKFKEPLSFPRDLPPAAKRNGPHSSSPKRRPAAAET